MKTIELATIQSEVVGEHTIALEKIGKGYTVSIIANRRMEKQWRIASPVIDTEAVSKHWHGYVVREMQQHVSTNSSGLPFILRSATSSDAQAMIQMVLNRL